MPEWARGWWDDLICFMPPWYEGNIRPILPEYSFHVERTAGREVGAVVEQFGPALNYVPAGGLSRFTRWNAIQRGELSAAGEYTNAILFRLPGGISGTGDFVAWLAHMGDAAVGSSSDNFVLAVDSDENMFVFTAGGNTLGQTTVNVGDGAYHLAVATWKQPAGIIRVYVDGELQYEVTGYGDTSNANPIYVGQRTDAAVSQCVVPFFSHHARALDEQEVLDWYGDVYAPIRMPRRRRAVAAAAPTGQFLRPDGDHANPDGWLNELGGSTDLYQSIDEVTPDDADWVEGP